MWRFNSIIVLVFIWLGDRSRFNKSCLHDLGVPNHHCYRVSSQFLVKFISLWIIKSFWSIYLQDNYHFKDLNIKKNGLIFRIQIKNVSRCNSRLKNPKKRSPNWTKTQTRAWHPRGPVSTLGVPIVTWQVPIDPKARLGPGTS